MTCLWLVHWAITCLAILPSLTTENRSFILEFHNNLRTQTSPQAADMKELKWDYELESIAQSYADKCIWGHNQNRVDEYNNYGHNVAAVGENIYKGSWWYYDIETAMNAWWNEVQDLRSGVTVNWWPEGAHYAQMAWADTDRIGCGYKIQEEPPCAGLGLYFVCDYLIAGNWLGLPPYEVGRRCSNCPSSHPYCSGGLCSATESRENVPNSGDQCSARSVCNCANCLGWGWSFTDEKCKFGSETTQNELKDANCGRTQNSVSPSSNIEHTEILASNSESSASPLSQNFPPSPSFESSPSSFPPTPNTDSTPSAQVSPITPTTTEPTSIATRTTPSPDGNIGSSIRPPTPPTPKTSHRHLS